jgi:hypothetical protein
VPLISPDHKKLVYFYHSQILPLHTYEVGVKLYDIDSQETSTIISCIEAENSDNLVIWTLPDMLGNATWVNGENFVFNSTKEGRYMPCMVDVTAKKMHHLQYNKVFATEATYFVKSIDENTWVLNLNGTGYASRLAVLENATTNIKKQWGHDSKTEDMTTLTLEDISKKTTAHADVCVTEDGFLEERYYIDGNYGHLYGYENFHDADGNMVPNNQRPVMVVLHGGPHWIGTGIFSH